ncbi:hypothetical protein CCR85_14550 [Rhodothalassium salexigens]|uniref:Uncharacterized protein n=1 Tax=Rhodothalassium salexigens DSM 2132 TaxID=1188247 RepID=A0A4R2PKQ2_RHOSA|nr:hypothetical protein [Rhodothalassium salexigens]MBB4211454.1 hypothetical protein [Rhodothalassium salexigens DSM 2132]MBK1639391.1 hypothetical protein [Rhodothalassium salexigens DSM 2132]MBK5912700.1 hypothetical protein [Rhodothalassium salexigens]TCP35374.1 hypothetical protein EV659_104226 [Rhodothalassium salexigens DSM 2132]
MAVSRTGPVNPVSSGGHQASESDGSKRKKKRQDDAPKGHTDAGVHLTLSPEAVAALEAQARDDDGDDADESDER